MTTTLTAAPAKVTDRASARAFASRHIMPVADEFDRTERVSPELLENASSSGLWAALVPAEFGGLGLDMLTLGAIHEEIGRACSSVRNLLTVHHMVTWAISRWGSPDQQQQWLPPMAAGDVLGAFCVTEPGGGGALARVASTARLQGDSWVIDGRKRWITGGVGAGLLLIFAVAEENVLPFLVPSGTPGVEVTPITGMLGTRASMIAEIGLNSVTVPASALLGPQRFAKGAVMTHTLDIGRYTVAAGSVGILQGCLDACLEHANRELPDGGTLGKYQLIRAKIAEMVTSVTAARLLLEHAGRSKDAGEPETIIATWIAKYFASRAAAAAASEAVQLLGAEGCGPGSVVARYYRDAKIMEIIEGSSEVQQLTIASHALRDRSR
jgi:alkylation response protein AidB-like acyl-CoA dehydrogenase